MSVDGAVRLIGAFTPLFVAMVPVLLAVIAYYTVKAKTIAENAQQDANANAIKADAAVKKVETTLTTTADTQNAKLEELGRVAQATHTLVNSNYGMALLAN